MDKRWKNLAERMEEESPDTYKFEESRQEAFEGRGAPQEWRRVRKSKKYGRRKWEKIVWPEMVSLFREYNLQRQQSKQEELTEDEEMKQQQRMVIKKDLIRKIRSKGGMDAENRWWVSELLAADCEKSGLTQDGKILCRNGITFLEDMIKEG